jgi:hypothetical protein
LCSSGQEGREILIWPLERHWTTLKLALLEWPTKKWSFVFFFSRRKQTKFSRPCGIKDQKMMRDVCNTSQAYRQKVYENGMLRRIIGPQKGKCGENCILSSFIIYTFHQILSGSLNHGGGSGRHMHVRGRCTHGILFSKPSRSVSALRIDICV